MTYRTRLKLWRQSYLHCPITGRFGRYSLRQAVERPPAKNVRKTIR